MTGSDVPVVTPRIVGVDPGGTVSGIVRLVGDRVDSGVLVSRTDDDADYHAELVSVLTSLVEEFEVPALVAVEGVNAPTGQMGMVAMDGLLRAAVVLGVVIGVCEVRGWEVVVVPPGGHGSGPLEAYPPALVGGRERRGAGRLRHARSAYDVARAAKFLGKNALTSGYAGAQD